MTYQDLEVVYETNHLIVVVKPAGILSQKDVTNDLDMMTLVKEYLKNKYNKPGEAFLGLVHRLDRMTSGLMVFGKTSKGASRLSEQIRNHEFIKKYFTVVENKITKDGTLTNKMSYDEKTKKAYLDENGKLAVLHYKVIKNEFGALGLKNNTLLEVLLETGRHHQIRLQMSAFSHPLLGDTLYGSKVKCKIFLHAYYLSFNDPVTKEKLEFIKYPTWYERRD